MRKEIIKHCAVCGLPVDLRKKEAGKFAERYTQHIKNPEYHYYCSEKCYQNR